MISYQERIDRIQNTNKVVYIDDWSVHQVCSVERVGNVIFVNTGRGLMLQDLEVMTLDEMGDATRALNFLKNKYNIL